MCIKPDAEGKQGAFVLHGRVTFCSVIYIIPTAIYTHTFWWLENLINGGNAINKMLFVCNIGIAVSEIQIYQIKIT